MSAAEIMPAARRAEPRRSCLSYSRIASGSSMANEVSLTPAARPSTMPPAMTLPVCIRWVAASIAARAGM